MKYLLLIRADDMPAPDERAVMQRELPGYIEEMDVLGNALQGPDTAMTVRVRDGDTLRRNEPCTGTTEFLAGIDVVSCADRQQAVQLAAAHPFARYHAIEVRPFYSE
jgi:hypothetical protein